jgi:hypothetical protein
VAVQAIYYPGFTLLGIGEPAALFAIAVLLFFTPRDRAAFLLTALALVCVFGMQAVYWMITHPTNKYWVTRADTTLGKAGTRFFLRQAPRHTRHAGRRCAIAGNTRTLPEQRYHLWLFSWLRFLPFFFA